MQSARMRHWPSILPHEWATILYLFLTGLLIAYDSGKLENPLFHISFRIGFIIVLFLAARFISPQNPFWYFIRNFLPLAALVFLYNETDYLNNLFFPNFDPQLSSIEQYLFGLQPSLLFSEKISFRWFAELMYLGYFSFYLILSGSLAAFYFMDREVFRFDMFVVLFSFYLYFIFFILFPVSGPQFFFTGARGRAPDAFFFGAIMHLIQRAAEVPTGAFPSSHVGISILLMSLCYRKSKRLFKYLLPLVIVLILSSVYIKAHYLIDVIAGIICVYPFYKMSEFVDFSLFQSKAEKGSSQSISKEL